MRVRLRPQPWIEAAPPYRARQKAATGDGTFASNEPLSSSRTAVEAATAFLAELHRCPEPLAEHLRAGSSADIVAPVDLVESLAQNRIMVRAGSQLGVPGTVWATIHGTGGLGILDRALS